MKLIQSNVNCNKDFREFLNGEGESLNKIIDSQYYKILQTYDDNNKQESCQGLSPDSSKKFNIVLQFGKDNIENRKESQVNVFNQSNVQENHTATSKDKSQTRDGSKLEERSLQVQESLHKIKNSVYRDSLYESLPDDEEYRNTFEDSPASPNRIIKPRQIANGTNHISAQNKRRIKSKAPKKVKPITKIELGTRIVFLTFLYRCIMKSQVKVQLHPTF